VQAALVGADVVAVAGQRTAEEHDSAGAGHAAPDNAEEHVGVGLGQKSVRCTTLPSPKNETSMKCSICHTKHYYFMKYVGEMYFQILFGEQTTFPRTNSIIEAQFLTQEQAGKLSLRHSLC
jgi:hypothetical protein